MKKRIKATEVYENRFYRIPKAFFKTDKYKNMSLETKVIYGFLDDRRELSLKNNWIDDEGCIYLIFTRKEIQEMLCLSDKPVTRAFKELQEYDLIDEVRQGLNKPNLIYVCHIDFENIEYMRIRKISDSENGENTIQDSDNIRSIETNLNNTNLIILNKEGFCQNEVREGISKLEITTSNSIPFYDFLAGLLKRCKTDYRKEILESIIYYYSKHKEVLGEEHIRYKEDNCIEIISRLDTIYSIGIEDETLGIFHNDIDVEAFKSMVDKHFETKYKKMQYTLMSFLNDKVLKNRFYEACY